MCERAVRGGLVDGEKLETRGDREHGGMVRVADEVGKRACFADTRGVWGGGE